MEIIIDAVVKKVKRTGHLLIDVLGHDSWQGNIFINTFMTRSNIYFGYASARNISISTLMTGLYIFLGDASARESSSVVRDKNAALKTRSAVEKKC